MKIHTVEVAYDSGRFQERMGLGPGALLQAGLINRLRFLGHEITVDRIRMDGDFTAEIGAAFSIARLVAPKVAKAQSLGAVSVVLSGNCNVALGTLAGLDPAKTGVLWFDAHGEFNTPETTTSGFLDGMGLSIATGVCWRPLAESIPGFTRIPPKNIVLAGVRETDPEEQALLDESGVQQAPAADVLERGIRPLLSPALNAMERRVDRFYVHFDLDVLDPSVASWNQWTPPRGLKREHVEEALELLAGAGPIAAIGFASHDPRLDPENSFEAARRILDKALAIAGA
jgi:arginase